MCLCLYVVFYPSLPPHSSLCAITNLPPSLLALTESFEIYYLYVIFYYCHIQTNATDVSCLSAHLQLLSLFTPPPPQFPTTYRPFTFLLFIFLSHAEPPFYDSFVSVQSLSFYRMCAAFGYFFLYAFVVKSPNHTPKKK